MELGLAAGVSSSQTDQRREEIHSSSEPQESKESKDPPSEHSGEHVRVCVCVCVCVKRLNLMCVFVCQSVDESQTPGCGQ